MKSYKVQYGTENYTKNSSTPMTVGQLKADATLKAMLGFGDNTRATINGVEQSNDTIVPDGATLVLETAANTKA